MPRAKSSVRKGMQDQRDRGRRKKHHKSQRCGGNGTKLEQFEAWLRDAMRDAVGDLVVRPSQSFPLKKYLQESLDIDMAPDEKLRQLAIFWEDECALMDQPKGWHILRWVYREAIRYDDQWPYHYHSVSISARCCAGFASDERVEHELLMDSRSACLQGLAVSPNHAELLGALGKTEYLLRNREAALDALNESLAVDPHGVWPALWKAQTLYDLERWSESLAACKAVDLGFFDKHQAWRAATIKDQMASCLLHLGERKLALEGFLASLSLYEQSPGTLSESYYLAEAVAAGLDAELDSRVRLLFEAEDMLYALED